MDWYKNRRYLHFDQSIGVTKATKIVTNPEEVASHSFLPFISYDISSRKIYKDGGAIKYKEKSRPIAFASHIDSHIYAYYCHKLNILYEEQINEAELDSSVLAFRKLGKNNIDFAYQAFKDIEKSGECTAIGLDISGFFNNLDHSLIKESWCRLLGLKRLPADHFAVFNSITKYSWVDREKAFKSCGLSLNKYPKDLKRICAPKDFRRVIRGGGLVERNRVSAGIPQGSPISAFLSNLYMLEFDKKVSEVVNEQGGSYYRYCDDMLFVVPTKWKNDVAGFVREEINKLKIDINISKTEICDFVYVNGQLKTEKPLQYLGFLFDGSQVVIRSSALAKYSERMRKGVRLAKKAKIKANRIRVKNGQAREELYKRKIYDRYSHLGRRNFIRYGLRAAERMNSKPIKRQLKPLWKKLNEEIGK